MENMQMMTCEVCTQRWKTVYIFEFIQRTNLKFCTLLQLKLNVIRSFAALRLVLRRLHYSLSGG